MLELATKTSKAKDEAVSQKNKLDSENEEKARQSAERKANDALLVNSNLELHKNAGAAFSSIKDTAKATEVSRESGSKGFAC